MKEKIIYQNLTERLIQISGEYIYSQHGNTIGIIRDQWKLLDGKQLVLMEALPVKDEAPQSLIIERNVKL